MLLLYNSALNFYNTSLSSDWCLVQNQWVTNWLGGSGYVRHCSIYGLISYESFERKFIRCVALSVFITEIMVSVEILAEDSMTVW